ncbi:hypothetical protein RN001_012053, partial [Aquatica leii]
LGSTGKQAEMKSIVLVSLALVAVANCRPDVSHLPSGSYLPAKQNSYDHSSHDETEEEKHVFFYASPGDGHHTKLQINVIPKSKKNTKVIFVKAPHHAGVIPEVMAPQSLAEDKTLVYVLVKKPVQDQSISIPSGLGIKQAKPEVFFIKYKNKEEAEAQVNKGIHGEKVGINVLDLENEYSFINALESKANGHSDEMSKADDHSKPHSDGKYTNVANGSNGNSQHPHTSLEAPAHPDMFTVIVPDEENGEHKHGPAGASGPY